MPGQVDEEVKAERLSRLNALLDRQRQAFDLAQIGKTLPVLIERIGRNPGQIGGKSPYLQAVHLDGPVRLLGQIVPITITARSANALAGVLAEQPHSFEAA